MLGRTLNLAAVMLVIGLFAAPAAFAQAQNLEAGKSPSQLFAGTCNACHRTPRGLLRTVSPGSLPGFLREHYTTSGEMASQLSAFLISNGAADTRRPTRQDGDGRATGASDQVDRQGRRLRRGAQEGASPEAESSSQAGRSARRQAQPDEAPDSARSATEVRGAAQAGTPRGQDGRRSAAKQGLSKQGRPGADDTPAAKDEPPKLEPAKDESAKGEAAWEEEGRGNEPKPSESKSSDSKESKSSDSASSESKSSEPKSTEVNPSEVKPSEVKPSSESKSEAAKIVMPNAGSGGETPVSRIDAPAPDRSAMPSSPVAAEPAAAEVPAPIPAEKPAMVKATETSAPARPSQPPVAAAGSPAPPISQ
jgi:hypothetical protein